MDLTNGKIGESYNIIKINLENSVKRRLEMLGMTDGAKILVLNSKHSGSMIIKVRGTRFAIGKRFADGIDVRRI